ncbi:MAG: hypothetical protein AABM30_10400, partial [Actinomycetota bacterium]
ATASDLSTVSITITDDDTGSDSDTYDVTVNNVAPTATVNGPSPVDEGSTHTYNFTVTDPGTDTFTVDATYPKCGSGGDFVPGTLMTNAGGGSFDCYFPDGPAQTNVSIKVTDDDGGSDTGSEGVQIVDVANLAPTVTLTGPSPVAEGSTNTYSYTTSDEGTETFTLTSQSCDGGTLSADTFNPVDGSGSFDCTYADGPSSHNPTVTVSDGDTGSDSDSLPVTVSNVAPSATFNNNGSVDEGSNINLSLTSPSDPSSVDTAAGFTYRFSCDNGLTWTAWSGTSTASCSTDDNGTRQVKGEIRDKDLEARTYSANVTVDNVAPSATFGNNGSVDEGSNINLSLTSPSDPSSVDTAAGFTYRFSCDNGLTWTAWSGTSTASCSTDDNGTRQVKGEIRDKDLEARTYSANVTVNNVEPSTPNLASPAGNSTTGDNTPAFDWSNSTDPAGASDTITYRIQANLGSCDFTGTLEINETTTSSDFTPLTSLPDGTYCWRVNASDEDGGTSAWSSVRQFTIDTGAPSVQSIDRVNGNPTNLSSVDWTVTFSESVTGVNSSDFALVQSGGVAGASITNVTGSGATYTVTANTGTGNGSLGLNLTDNDSITDGGGNTLQASGGGANGSFTGQVYTIDKTSPSVTINQAGDQADPTTATQIHFTAVFNEPVFDFQNGDVTIGGTAGASNATVTNPLGDNRTFEIYVSGMTTAGTVTASIGANKANDAAGNVNSASTSTDNTVTWQQNTVNAAPVVTITSPTFGQLYAKPANVSLSSTFVDTDGPNPHTCSINWDDGTTTTPAVNETTRTCAQNHTFNAAGVYTIVVTICDNLGACGTNTVWVVVYDASAGFVTGGGWIDVARGSYPADPTLSGRANFGFNAKYKNGGGPPQGATEFNFQVANFNFHSETYSWLVVSSFKAQFRGTGSVNGVSGYDFRLTGYDGQISGGGGIDKFRIKITRTGTGQTVFDNRMGVPEDPDVADPQAISGGSIVIHRA